MQVQTVWEAGSERLTWRRFLLQTTLLLTILLVGGATICWIAANWPEWSRLQRLVSTQGLMVSVALAGIVALARGLRRVPAPRRSGASALLGLACVVLGALLALVGQTYQTGANTATLFFTWAVLMLPWAWAARSPSIWLLFIAVVNTGVMLLFPIFNFGELFGISGLVGYWQIPLNLGFLAVWVWFARGNLARAQTGPRLLAALVLASATFAAVGYHPWGLFSPGGLVWLLAIGALWLVYRYARYDSAILGMALVSAVTIVMYVFWHFDERSWELTFFGTIVIFITSGAWGAAWLRKSAARAPSPADEEAAWEAPQRLPLRIRASVILAGSALAVIAWEAVYGQRMGRTPIEGTHTYGILDELPAGVLTTWAIGGAIALIVLVAAKFWLTRVAATAKLGAPHSPADAAAADAAAADAVAANAVAASDVNPSSGAIGAQSGVSTQPNVTDETDDGVNPGRSVAALVLATASAWIASIFLIFLLGASGIITEELVGVWGVGLAILAIVGIRITPNSLFMRQNSVTLGFAGLLLLVLDVFMVRDTSSPAVWMLLAFSLAVYVLGRDPFLRFLTSWILAAIIAWMIMVMPGNARDFDYLLMDLLEVSTAHPLSGWTIVTFALATIAAVAFLLDRYATRRWHLPLQPLAWGMALAAVALCIHSTSIALTDVQTLWALNPGTAATLLLAGCLPALAAIAVMAPLSHTLPWAMRLGVPVGLLVLGLLWLPSPGITVSLTWMILGFGLRNRLLLALGTVALVGYLVVYYYQLGVPLLQKSFWLGLGGLASCLFYALLLRAQRKETLSTRAAMPLDSPDGAPSRLNRLAALRPAVAAFGLLFALGIVNFSVWQKEQLIAHGQPVLLLLAPVDPRSLMQGDYMTLDFQVTRALREYLEADSTKIDAAESLTRAGYAVLDVDKEGIGHFSHAQQQAEPLAENQVAVRYRVGVSGPVMLTNAFFFPEGQATHFEESRYGVLRVDGKGNALLTGMQDADRKPL